MAVDAAHHPEVEIRNSAGGSRIEVLVHDPMTPQFWDELELRLLRVVQVRQPAELLIDLIPDEDASGLASCVERLAGAVHEFGGELVVTAGGAERPPA